MKLARLTDSRFHGALSRLNAQQVPLRAAFKLKGIAAKVQQELQKFEECRDEALRRYGQKDDKGDIALNEDGSVKFDTEKLKSFVEELNLLGATEVEIPTVTLSELGDVKLSGEDVAMLDGLIVE